MENTDAAIATRSPSAMLATRSSLTMRTLLSKKSGCMGLSPFFASSSIMHVRTKAEKLMPRMQGLLFRRVAQGVRNAQGHGDLVAVHQEAPDFGLVGIALDEHSL